MSVQAVFGLSATALPTLTEIDHVLAGRRADGAAPQTANDQPIPAHVIRGAQRRFRAAVGLPAGGEPTAEQRARLAARKLATGAYVDKAEYRRAITATRSPVGFADLTFSASKSLSTAWALASSESDRAALLGIHQRAVDDTMRFIAERLGWARKGDGGHHGDLAEIAWITYQHYTARPTENIVRTDAEGNPYTDPREIPTMRADPQIHSHVVVLNHALVEDTGRLGSIDFDRLKGFVHQGGEVYRAYAAKHARQLGIAVHIGEQGDAQLSHVDLKLQRLFSKRSQQAHEAAESFAKEKGLDWNTLGPEQKIALLRTGAAETRAQKAKDAASDFTAWRAEAAHAGLEQRSVLKRQAIRPELAPERRHEDGYERVLPMVDRLFQSKAVALGDEIRALGARSLIMAGIGDRASDDITAITRKLRRQGVRHDGKEAALVVDRIFKRGKEHTIVSTDRHITTEESLVAIARTAVADRSASLSPAAIDRAAAAYLKRHPDIDRAGHWQRQVEWMHQLGEGGRLSVGIGSAGVGKSTVIQVLTEAWQAEGREVFGACLAWSPVGDMDGISATNRAAMDPFLKRAAEGQYALDPKSVIVVDEVGLLGNRQMRELLRLAETTGATICMIGDPAQCRSPEAGDPLELIARVMPTAIPALVQSIRQKTAHELAVTQAFRDNPAEGLAMKIEDGSARLVAGGTAATIEQAVQLRRERLAANAHDPDYTLAIMAPTNASAAAISAAIRADRQKHGEIGPDLIELSTVDRTGRHTIALGIGDEVRVYRRVNEGRRVIANNGEAVAIRAVDEIGMAVRNLKTGVEGRIAWSKLRQGPTGPVQLSYAGCSTVDAKQGLTASEGMLVLAGSTRAPSNRVYTALSRHRSASFLLVDEAAVRRTLAKQAVIGEPINIRQADIWRQVGAEFSRPQIRENATSVLGGISGASEGIPGPMSQEEQRPRLALYARERVMRVASQTREQITNAVRKVRSMMVAGHRLYPRRRGPSLGM